MQNVWIASKEIITWERLSAFFKDLQPTWHVAQITVNLVEPSREIGFRRDKDIALITWKDTATDHDLLFRELAVMMGKSIAEVDAFNIRTLIVVDTTSLDFAESFILPFAERHTFFYILGNGVTLSSEELLHPSEDDDHTDEELWSF